MSSTVAASTSRDRAVKANHRQLGFALLCLPLLACEGFHVQVPSSLSKVRTTGRPRFSLALEAHRGQEATKLSHFFQPLVPLLLSAALALPVNAFEPSVYTNNYGDPFHPLCERRIEVSEDGKSFKYSGTAVGPKDDPVRRGCTPEEIEEYTLRTGAFEGSILADGKLSAGDGIHEGVWEPAGSKDTTLGYEDVDGIRWNDGNKWFVLQPKEEKAAEETVSVAVTEAVTTNAVATETEEGTTAAVEEATEADVATTTTVATESDDVTLTEAADVSVSDVEAVKTDSESSTES